MPLTATEVFDKLKEWPHRGVGTEEEMEAREALITVLTGEFEVEITEEGFEAPKSYLPFFWATGLTCAAAVLFAPAMPLVMLLLGALGFISFFLFMDWRVSPLIWWGAQETTANLVARKGEGRRLIILMAHIDSAPASFAYRPGQVRNFKSSVYLSTALMSLGVLVPLFAGLDATLDVGGRILVAALLIGAQILASIDFWRFGFTPGANDNLTGVAAATSAASHLWQSLPADAEVRLVISSAEEAGMLGAQHYWQTHRDELKERDTFIVNIDTVGCTHLRYVVKSGGFSAVRYDNALTRTAQGLTKLEPGFHSIRAGEHRVGDFDSVWFNRDRIPALTIASYDDDGLMPAIHTPEDTADKVDKGRMEQAARFAEAIARHIHAAKGE